MSKGIGLLHGRRSLGISCRGTYADMHSPSWVNKKASARERTGVPTADLATVAVLQSWQCRMSGCRPLCRMNSKAACRRHELSLPCCHLRGGPSCGSAEGRHCQLLGSMQQNRTHVHTRGSGDMHKGACNTIREPACLEAASSKFGQGSLQKGVILFEDSAAEVRSLSMLVHKAPLTCCRSNSPAAR